MDGLDARSREPDAGVLLPGGVRVIDMVVGDGPTPAEGRRIYAHYKVWAATSCDGDCSHMHSACTCTCTCTVHARAAEELRTRSVCTAGVG